MAALPSPASAPSSDRRLWDRRLARYRSLAARAREVAESGWFRAANDAFARAMRRGSAADEGARAAAWERMAAAEDRYRDACTAPLQRAAVALALAPAPDLAALAAKIGTMRDEDLPELARMRRNCFDLLATDVRRIAAAQRR